MVYFYRCGRVALFQTSWTDENPGRRFYCCHLSKAPGACEFFRWHDDQMPDQTRTVIYGLLRKVNTYEKERVRSKWIIVVVVVYIIWTWFRDST
ncbi:hypothetical protein A4A49_58329 [Nicotiana attenuata]|uniref:GRF-type domain-containing protein n=1 Tax=Nicotiana attenuata TaxID=49451 RepID=A0A314LBK6_NICAT|nr:hypothetical protein A4A49_58329 [Nicotiana attenuata]